MFRSRRPPAAVSGLLAVAALLLIAGGAYGASTVSYAGRTSQRQPISFAISAGKLVHLSFRFKAHCPNHRVYLLPAFKFAPIPVAHASFDQKFRTNQNVAVIKGKVKRNRVTGSLDLRVFISRAHNFCSGHATYVAALRRAKSATSGH